MLYKNEKLQLYGKFKDAFYFEVYLSNDMHWKYKIALTRFCCVNHKLAIESHRYTGCGRDERFCDTSVETIEDEIHFLLVCPQFIDLRKKYLDKYLIEYYNLSDNFVNIMNSTMYQRFSNFCV